MGQYNCICIGSIAFLTIILSGFLRQYFEVLTNFFCHCNSLCLVTFHFVQAAGPSALTSSSAPSPRQRTVKPALDFGVLEAEAWHGVKG